MPCDDLSDLCSSEDFFLRAIPDPSQGSCCGDLVCVRSSEGQDNPTCLYQCVGEAALDGVTQACSAGDSVASAEVRVGEPLAFPL